MREPPSGGTAPFAMASIVGFTPRNAASQAADSTQIPSEGLCRLELSDMRYGLLWWVMDYPFRGESLQAYFAAGNGGQLWWWFQGWTWWSRPWRGATPIQSRSTYSSATCPSASSPRCKHLGENHGRGATLVAHSRSNSTAPRSRAIHRLNRSSNEVSTRRVPSSVSRRLLSKRS